MRRRTAAAFVGLVAVLAYAPALRNGFAYDDGVIVELNPTAHSIRSALRSVDEPYWPAKHPAGLWRPLTILSFAADWQLSGGSPAVMHGTNVLLHAAVTALAVPVLAAYVPVPAAMVGAWVFAVHPVHVEAVANLVGRSEMLVALFLMLAILVSRRVRAPPKGGPALEVAVLGAVALALVSKEHAVVAVGLLLLDDVAQRKDGRRLPLRLYAGVVVVTAVWLVLRARVDQGMSFRAMAPVFMGLDAEGRIATMGPVIFDIVRLLTWPFRLMADYQPQVVARLEDVTPLSAAGLGLLGALAALSLALWARHRAASVGLLLVAVPWSPTSNLLFASGVILAERTLYLPSLGVALIVAVLADRLLARYGRRVVLAMLVPLLGAFTVRTVTRIPTWRSTKEVVIDGLLNYPESYKAHQAAARVLSRMQDWSGAFREYQLSVELYRSDPYNLGEAGLAAVFAGRPGQALPYLRAAVALDSAYMPTQQYFVSAYLALDSVGAALEHARRAVMMDQRNAESRRLLAVAFVEGGQFDSARAVWPSFERAGGDPFERWLLAASTFAATGQSDSAVSALARAIRLVPADSGTVARLALAAAEVRRVVRGERQR